MGMLAVSSFLTGQRAKSSNLHCSRSCCGDKYIGNVLSNKFEISILMKVSSLKTLASSDLLIHLRQTLSNMLRISLTGLSSDHMDVVNVCVVTCCHLSCSLC